jgi:2-iminobutanoate/2-iminopropanoate deaminase
MPRQAIGPAGTLPDGTPNPISPVVRAGDFLFVSGLMPKTADGQMADGDITMQTGVVMDRLAAVLVAAGCTLDDVVKCTVWLTDAADFKAFNAMYGSYFTDQPPARSALRSDLLLPGARLELEAVCYRPMDI